MGETQYDCYQLSREIFRRDTYGDTLNDIKHDLVKAGFYYTRIGQKVKCFSCLFEFDASEVSGPVDYVKYHKIKSPYCSFINDLKFGGVNGRPKKFLSYDSLRYEKERRETFIEWPLPWLFADDLAADGFYYLRTHDHCACVFCRGIVGAWEVGDTPRGEHKRHFPHCPFIRGQPVGNVPMSHSRILDKLPLDGEECPVPQPRNETTTVPGGKRHLPGSYGECKGHEKKNMNLIDVGLRQYTGPKRKDYITKESRRKSFKRWPERVVQKPEDMADAGFFYCGLSDHVRCFHCGNGLHNWECEDDPWYEHARWYPECNFVLFSKRQQFIDEVRRERPPCLRTAVSKDNNKPQKVSASSGRFKPISDSDLECLMNSDIIMGVKDMGFSQDKIRTALRQKLQQTGMPFFNLNSCTETVLKIMEDETQRELPGSNSVNIQVEQEEARNFQDKKMAEHNQTSSHDAGSVSALADILVCEIPAVIPHSTEVQAPQLQNNPINAVTVFQPSLSGILSSDNALSKVSAAQSTLKKPEAMDFEEEEVSAKNMETQPLPNTTTAEGRRNVATASSEIVVLDMQEVDERINILTEESLKSARSGPPSLETNSKNEETSQDIEKQQQQQQQQQQVSPVKINKNKSLLTGKEAALESERIKENRNCKICMDAETEVVFLPCSHMASCSSCAVTMAQCPICRADIKYTITPIIS